MRSLTPERTVTDAAAFVGFLDGQAAVASDRWMGTTGYCMGGAMTMCAAAAFPDRIDAGASFRGGRLVTGKPDSSRQLVGRIRARCLFAIAENNDEQEPKARTVLRTAFDAAGLPAEIEVCAGTLHD